MLFCLTHLDCQKDGMVTRLVLHYRSPGDMLMRVMLNANLRFNEYHYTISVSEFASAVPQAAIQSAAAHHNTARRERSLGKCVALRASKGWDFWRITDCSANKPILLYNYNNKAVSGISLVKRETSVRKRVLHFCFTKWVKAGITTSHTNEKDSLDFNSEG